MGQFRRLVFEYALKVKSKDEVFDEMLQLAQAAAGPGKLGDLSALKSLTGASGLSGLGDIEALKGLVTQALKAAGPGLASRRPGPPQGEAAAAGPRSRPAPPPVSRGRKDMPSVLGTRVRAEAPATAEPPASEPGQPAEPDPELLILEVMPEPLALEVEIPALEPEPEVMVVEVVP